MPAAAGHRATQHAAWTGSGAGSGAPARLAMMAAHDMRGQGTQSMQELRTAAPDPPQAGQGTQHAATCPDLHAWDIGRGRCRDDASLRCQCVQRAPPVALPAVRSP